MTSHLRAPNAVNKNIFIALFCLGVSSCAFNDYTMNYNNALKTKTNITVNKEGDFEELNKRIAAYFEALGYEKIIFADPKKKFFVFAKEGDFGEPCQIILKYTIKTGSDKIRIDLVKESDDLVTDGQVADDIQKIADQI